MLGSWGQREMGEDTVGSTGYPNLPRSPRNLRCNPTVMASSEGPERGRAWATLTWAQGRRPGTQQESVGTAAVLRTSGFSGKNRHELGLSFLPRCEVGADQ